MKKSKLTTERFLKIHQNSAILAEKCCRYPKLVEQKILSKVEAYTFFQDIIETSSGDLVILTSIDHYEKIRLVYNTIIEGIKIDFRGKENK